MQPNNPPAINRKMLFIAIGASLLIIVGIIVFAATQASKPSANPSASGTPTPTPTPVDPAKAPNTPTYLNFDSLLENGLTDDQLDAVKYAFVKFGQAKGAPVTKVNIDPVSLNIVLHTKANPLDVATFNVTVNEQTTYAAKVEYAKLSLVRLYLNDYTTKAAVYDSGPIDLYNGTGN